jgi:glycosyltransferase involved in cell wall biosynthesis
MKLLYITNGIAGIGGLERVLSIKASYLADHFDYDITILSLNEQFIKPFYIFSDRIKFISITVKVNTFLYIYSYISALRKAVKDVKPNVISVCDDGLKGFFAPQIIKGIPIIYERHASILLNISTSINGRITKYLMQSQIKYFEKFVVLTESGCKEWNRKNVVAIPNPLSFYPDKSSSLTNKKIIVVGSHSYHKGYDLLFQTWQIVSTQYPDWELHIYGKIDTHETYLKMAIELNLAQSIYFYSPANDIQQAYLDSSIMLLSSRSEGFGMVLIEAMACGVPCISFDCPSGPSDIITEGVDGFLVPLGNTKAFAQKIIYLISNEKERIEMGKAAKENVKRYLPENIVLLWDQLFREVAANGK